MCRGPRWQQRVRGAIARMSHAHRPCCVAVQRHRRALGSGLAGMARVDGDTGARALELHCPHIALFRLRFSHLRRAAHEHVVGRVVLPQQDVECHGRGALTRQQLVQRRSTHGIFNGEVVRPLAWAERIPPAERRELSRRHVAPLRREQRRRRLRHCPEPGPAEMAAARNKAELERAVVLADAPTHNPHRVAMLTGADPAQPIRLLGPPVRPHPPSGCASSVAGAAASGNPLTQFLACLLTCTRVCGRSAHQHSTRSAHPPSAGAVNARPASACIVVQRREHSELQARSVHTRCSATPLPHTFEPPPTAPSLARVYSCKLRATNQFDRVRGSTLQPQVPQPW